MFTAPPGSLEDWLTARYALYSSAAGQLYRGHIHHAPWPLQRASYTIETNTVADQIGLPLIGPPHALFARRLDVQAWLIERV